MMTDNEIIKALECCISSGDCKGCPSYIEKDDDCLGIKWLSILDLINRQKAENERLRTETRLLLANSVTELYPHCSFVDNGVFVSKEQNGYEKWNAYVRNQAYKEFADKIQSKLFSYMNIDDVYDIVDNLLKEMVGEE